MYVYVTLASYFGVIIHPPPENGLLASRIEILTRHQSETLKKMGESALFILTVVHNNNYYYSFTHHHFLCDDHYPIIFIEHCHLLFMLLYVNVMVVMTHSTSME